MWNYGVSFDRPEYLALVPVAWALSFRMVLNA
jgi:hypothetical protein